MILGGTVQTFVCTHPAAIILPLSPLIFLSVTPPTLTTLPTSLSPPHTSICTTILSSTCSILSDCPCSEPVLSLCNNNRDSKCGHLWCITQFSRKYKTLGQFFRWKNWCIEKVSTFLKNPLVWNCSSSSTWDQGYLFENGVYVLRDSTSSSLFLVPFPEATSDCLLIPGNYQVAMING